MLQVASDNVAQTIGVPYEIIAIDNSQGRYGICEAYNIGASQSRYELLCFMHEDMIFHTPNWGQKVAAILADESIGLLGVGGSQYVPDVPTPWWEVSEKDNYINVLHTTDTYYQRHDYRNYENQQLVDVVVIDGLWMCTRKAIWQRTPFDQKTFDQFHFYDIDFSTDVQQRARVCVTFDITIEHFSYGSLNDSWLVYAIKYQQKRKGILPLGTSTDTKTQQSQRHKEQTHVFLHRVLKSKASRAEKSAMYKYLVKRFINNPTEKDIYLVLGTVSKNILTKKIPFLRKASAEAA